MQSGGVPKYVISNLKINNFKEKYPQENLIAIFLSQINVDEHVSREINTFRLYKGGGGGLGDQPPRNRRFFLKRIKQNGGFSLIFLLFDKAP